MLKLISLIFFPGIVLASSKYVELNDFPFKTPYQATVSSLARINGYEKFDEKGEERRLSVISGREKFHYKTWMQKKQAPLVLLIPGIGGHFRSNETLALGQFLFNHGFSVAAGSSAFNFQFMESALSHGLPGYTPSDVKDVHHAYRYMVEDIRGRNPNLITNVSLIGISIGGLHALFMAREESHIPAEERIGISSYVAINPPVDLDFTLRQIDGVYEIFRNWSDEQKKYLYLKVMHQISLIDGTEDGSRKMELIKALGDDELKIAIGTALRFSLFDIFTTAKRLGVIDEMIKNGHLQDLNVTFTWFNRRHFYDVLEKNYSFTRYAFDALIPYYQGSDSYRNGREMLLNAGMRTLAQELSGNLSITVMTNVDDFLTHNEVSLQWLKQNFSQNLVLFDKGGHVGNLFAAKVQNEIVSALENPPSHLNFDIALVSDKAGQKSNNGNK